LRVDVERVLELLRRRSLLAALAISAILSAQTSHELLNQVLHGGLVLPRQIARSRDEQLSDSSSGIS
jgi:hypothetical protein